MQSLMTHRVLGLHHSQQVSAFGNSYLFTGRRFDNQTGMYYNRNRYYEPRKGRFLSRDQIGYQDSPNFYAYTQNNPINRTDPLGQKSLPLRPRKYRTKRNIFMTFVNSIPKKGARGKVSGRTTVFYGTYIYCGCSSVKKYRVDGERKISRKFVMLAKYVVDYRIRILEAYLTSYGLNGIYGHEMTHIQSIEKAVKQVHGTIVEKIRKQHSITYDSLEECRKKIKSIREFIDDKLSSAIKLGAGHDTNPSTIKPAEGELIPPGGKGPNPRDEAREAMNAQWTAYHRRMDASAKKLFENNSFEGLVVKEWIPPQQGKR